MYTRSAAGAWLARRPYVVKLTGDPAFERARRFDGARGFDRFQQAPDGPVARALRLARDVSLRRARLLPERVAAQAGRLFGRPGAARVGPPEPGSGA